MTSKSSNNQLPTFGRIASDQSNCHRVFFFIKLPSSTPSFQNSSDTKSAGNMIIRRSASAFVTPLLHPIISKTSTYTPVAASYKIRSLSSLYSSSFLSPRRSASCLQFQRSKASIVRLLTMATASKDQPGVLDTDDSGGVLIFPRQGTVSFSYGDEVTKYSGDLLVLGVWANDQDDPDAPYQLPSTLAEFDKKIANGVLADLIKDADFKAKPSSVTEVARLTSGPVKRVVLFGLGKRSAGSLSAGLAARAAISKGSSIKDCKSVGLFIDDAHASDIVSAAEGAVLGGYIDERYREHKDAEKIPEQIVLVGVSESDKTDAAIQKGRSIALGVITTKELVSAPANCLTPQTLAIASRTVASEGGLDVKVMGRSECEKLGMGAYLGVGRGSTDEPQFIHMIYRPKGDVKKKICLVGKAVTFDTGGTNLKTGPGSMIDMMKFDMGGSAVVLGTAKIVGETKPDNVEIHFIMPAVENMIGDRAIHPGDILKASNGKTVEVLNTDAEGRLCLADALVYAENLGDVDYVVDLATLTGAIIISLGNDVAGMFTTSDELADSLSKAGKEVGEALWRMPLVDEYAEQLKSKIADLRNIGTGRAGSSIVAALFLREFVKTKNWAHLDIAGTVWSDKKGGATGYGVKTMYNWIESLSEGSTSK